MKTITGQKDGKRKIPGMLPAVAAALVLVLAIAMLVLSGKTSFEKQVKARYDGQTYPKAATASRDDHYDYNYDSGMFDGFAGGAKNELTTAAAPDFDMSYADEAMPSESFDYDTGGEAAPVPAHGKKLVYTYDYTVESTDFDGFLSDLNDTLDRLGGYMEYSRLDRREHDRLDGNGILSLRRGDYTIRVPVGSVKDVIKLFSSGSAQTTYENVRMLDKTAAYADAETQLASYQREYRKLEALLDEAESVSDTIAIQDRLSSLNYSIEWAKKQMSLIDEDVDYATLELELYEVVYYTASISAYRYEFGEELARAFRNFIYTVPEFLFVMIYLSIGILVAAGTGSAVVGLAVRRFRKKRGEQVIKIIDGRTEGKEDKDNDTENP